MILIVQLSGVSPSLRPLVDAYPGRASRFMQRLHFICADPSHPSKSAVAAISTSPVLIQPSKLIERYEPLLDRIDHGLCAMREMEFAQNVADVSLDRLF